MKLKKRLIIALLFSSTVLAVGCASDGHQQSGGEVISDSLITTRVKSALLAERDVNSFDIGVETFNGTVQLSGFVGSQWQIDKAVQIVESVNSVKQVKNNLIHKPN